MVRGFGIAAISIGLWYAHPFPLAIVVGLVALHVASLSTWQARISAGLELCRRLRWLGSFFS